METEPESEAVRKSLKKRRRAVSVLFWGDKLTGRCAKDCFDPDNEEADLEKRFYE